MSGLSRVVEYYIEFNRKNRPCWGAKADRGVPLRGCHGLHARKPVKKDLGFGRKEYLVKALRASEIKDACV